MAMEIITSKFWILTSVMIMGAAQLASVTAEGSHDAPSQYFVREMLVRAQQHLTTGLYKSLARQEGNLVISPWSVMSLLTVAYVLAGGKTASEIEEHLKIPLLRKKELYAGFYFINSMFNEPGADPSSPRSQTTTVESVNTAFVGGGLAPAPRVQRNLRHNLNAYIGQLPSYTTTSDSDNDNDNDSLVLGNATTSVPLTPEKAINDLVALKTRGLIDELLPPGTIRPNQTALWLFNVLYFEGFWKHPFNPGYTHQAAFKVGGHLPVRVPTMTVTAALRRSAIPELEMHVLELPYGHHDLYSLFLLLPDKDDGLPALERRLKTQKLQNVLAGQYRTQLTKVYLPRFKFHAEMDLMDAMRRMGFKKMFQKGDAVFSKLEGDCPDSAYVTKLVHKAVIDVSETGTTAAAATAMRLSARRFAYHFRADHPFMFVLRDNRLGINLFVGRVTDPRELS